MNGSERRSERLKSWKEIAAFFGTDERTVRRWESRGLPVRRIPGGGRATVFAEVAELETWMQGRGDPESSLADDNGDSAVLMDDPDIGPPATETIAAPASSPAPRTARFAWPRAVLAGVLTLALAGTTIFFVSQSSGTSAPVLSRHQPPQKAVDLFLTATYNWEKRTPDSLQRARDLFGRAIAEDPDYAEAYAGLANTYLLLREFSVMPPSEAYPRAKEAAQRALSLDPNLAGAHAALAFVTFFWTRDWQSGLARFQRATALDPSAATAWHWYGTALLHAGQIDAALKALEEAQRREPTSRAIVADKALATYFAGRKGDAVGILHQLTLSDPEFYSPHAYLAGLSFADGDFATWFHEALIAARLQGNADEVALVTRAEEAFRTSGREAMLRTMIAEERAQRAAGRGSDYELAALYAALDDKDAALRLLDAADRAGESGYLSLRVDRRFVRLWNDPRFRKLRANVGRPPPGRA